jgi:peptide/nickel transport system permease protein
MARFIVLRLLHTILILFGVSIVAFGLIHLIPGNPLDILLPPEAPKEVVERLKVEFGFDKPLYIQYLAWLGRVLQGNLGTSVFTGLRVTGELLSALGNTFVLAIPAALLGFSLGAPPDRIKVIEAMLIEVFRGRSPRPICLVSAGLLR